MDRLTEMFVRQGMLQRKAYGVPLEFMTQSPDVRAEYVRTSALAAIMEVGEALDETGWKPWATDRGYDVGRVVGELVDAWHFIMNMMLASGVDPHDLAEMFFEKFIDKNTLNAQRQADGYDGKSTKCPHCLRALDDVGVGQSRQVDYLVFSCGGCQRALDPALVLGSSVLSRLALTAEVLGQS